MSHTSHDTPLLPLPHTGKLTDVWSLGCILLELTIGHDTFNELWMVAYDYNNLVAPERFAQKIVRAVEAIRSVMKDVDLLDLVTSLLRVVPSQRSSVASLYGATAAAAHPWLRRPDEDPDASDARPVEPAMLSQSEERATLSNLATFPTRSVAPLSARTRAGSDGDVLLDTASGTTTPRGSSIPILDAFGDGNGASSSPSSSKRALASPREKLSPLDSHSSGGRLTAQRPISGSPKHKSSPALSTYGGGGVGGGGGGGGGGGRKVLGRKSPRLAVTDADEHVRIPDGSTNFPPPSPMASGGSQRGGGFGSSPRMKEPMENAATGGNPSPMNGGRGAPSTPTSPVKLWAAHTPSTGIKRNVALAVDVGPRARHLTSTGKALPISNMSNKARADYGQDLHMPPLDPETPNIHGARKNFRRLQDTVGHGSSSGSSSDMGASPDNGTYTSNEPWSPGGDSTAGASGSTPGSNGSSRFPPSSPSMSLKNSQALSSPSKPGKKSPA